MEEFSLVSFLRTFLEYIFAMANKQLLRLIIIKVKGWINFNYPFQDSFRLSACLLRLTPTRLVRGLKKTTTVRRTAAVRETSLSRGAVSTTVSTDIPLKPLEYHREPWYRAWNCSHGIFPTLIFPWDGFCRRQRGSSLLWACYTSKLRKLYFQFLSHWIGYDHGHSFLSIMNQMELHLLRQENCQHNHIPLNVKGIGNIVFSVCSHESVYS